QIEDASTPERFSAPEKALQRIFLGREDEGRAWKARVDELDPAFFDLLSHLDGGRAPFLAPEGHDGLWLRKAERGEVFRLVRVVAHEADDGLDVQLVEKLLRELLIGEGIVGVA